jgi:DNA replication licensing factor MCM2
LGILTTIAMSSSDTEERTESARKRRRIAADSDEDEDNDDNNNDDDDVEESPASRRRVRLEALAAERRRQRLQREVAELHNDDFEPAPEQQQNNSDVDDEADEDHDYEDGDVDNVDDAFDPEEEEDGEDLMENAERDYQRIEALDTYGTEGIDDRDYESMDMEQRRAAEAELRARDRQAGRGGRDAGIYGTALDEMEADEDEEARRARRGMFRKEQEADEESEEEDKAGEDDIDEEDLDGEDPINLEAFDVPLREWLAQGRTKREVQRKFRAFLRHFRPETAGEDYHRRKRANGIYEQKIKSMCASNLSSLQISYDHLMEAEPLLAFWLADAPWDMLNLLDLAATNHTFMLFPSYKEIKDHVHVRISDVPIMDSLRDLRRTHLEHLVKVHGVVTRRGGVYPLLLYPVYKCMNKQCNFFIFPDENVHERVGKDAGHRAQPEACPHCEGSQFKLDNMKSVYGNAQRVNLQETPGSVPPGRVPRQKEVFLTDDLIDSVRPGEEIEVTGIFQQQQDFSLTMKSGFPVFSTNLLANHIRKREDASSASNMTEGDIRKILELSRDPKIGDRIVQSMAPSIFGHDNCKMALAMSLFGGVPKNINDKHRIRGDVNVLLLGDPGTAKSQLLKYAEVTAPRAVYSTGKGASAVGLTAGVHKDPVTREWTLEGGALVLADKGVALIDEFDKSECSWSDIEYICICFADCGCVSHQMPIFFSSHSERARSYQYSRSHGTAIYFCQQGWYCDITPS